MNSPLPHNPANPAAHETSAGGRMADPICNSPDPALQAPIRNSPSLPGEVLAAAGKEASQSAIRDLLDACLRMLKLTGGSQYWTGDTQAALEFMEAAVAAALAIGASSRACGTPSAADGAPPAPFCGNPDSPETESARTPLTGTPAVVPEIVASVATSLACSLQMAGVETERWRTAV